MTDEDFIHEILSHPFDTTFRDIYADWLEDQGDARAHFLHLQRQFRASEPFSDAYQSLVQEERSAQLHRRIDPIWWEKIRQFSTPPPPVDVTENIPGLAEHRRTVTRLHPQRVHYAIDPHFSKIGGQFLWPQDEPWPISSRGLPLVPILQLRAWDFPQFDWPESCDLMQLFWTPQNEDEENRQPIPYLFCRRADEVTGPLAQTPSAERAIEALGMTLTEEENEWNFPFPCGIYPERIMEFPSLGELDDEELREEIQTQYPQADEELYYYYPEEVPYPDYRYHLSRCPGWTLGGHDAYDEDDNRLWRRLGTFSTREYDRGNAVRWMPLEMFEPRSPGFRLVAPAQAHDLNFGPTRAMAFWVCFDGRMPNVRMMPYGG